MSKTRTKIARKIKSIDKDTIVFNRLYSNLNNAQKQAVDTIEGPVMVIAGPGTGKTTILTLRIANIIKQTDTEPDSILALTFTESGAFAMKRKLADIIGSAAYKVNIFTFHAFAEKIISEYPDYFPRIIGSRAVTDAEQIRIIEGIVDSGKIESLRPYGDPLYYVKPILREISVLKRENISPARLKESLVEDEIVLKKDEEITDAKRKAEEVRIQKNEDLALAYEMYEREMTKKRYYDFDDMLLEVIKAIENYGELKLILQENYQYILADEHQDANAAQNRILELLSDFHDSPNIFIVGDDKQAIYRFQGASLENFLYFKEKYKDAVVIDLTHNYRSTQEILDSAHNMISKNPAMPNKERVKLVSSLKTGTPIEICEYPNTQSELSHIADKIQVLLDKDVPHSEIAILYRDNSHASLLSKVLESRGIVFRVESDMNILKEPDVMKLIILLRAVNDPSSDDLAKVLFFKELGCDPGEVADFVNEAKRLRIPLYKHMSNARQNIKVAYKRIQQWSSQASSMDFADFLHLIISESGMIESLMSSPQSGERLDALNRFYDKAMNVSKIYGKFMLSDFIDYASIVENHGISSKRVFSDHLTGVRLMTAHRSKGQEFDHVFIIHARDGIWGNRRSRNLFHIPIVEHARDTGRIEDERRLFYVAVTRARHNVYISYSLIDADKECISSQFLGELLIPNIFKNNDTIHRPIERSKIEAAKNHKSVLNPEFVRSRFLGQPLSVTHINNYISCAWRYFFLNLIRIPERQNKHQMYGTAIHASLRAFFEAYKKDNVMGKKQVIALFEQSLGKEPMNTVDFKDALAKGKKALSGYLDFYDNIWSKNILTEYSLNGSLDLVHDEVLELTGKIDKIEILNGNTVNVVDYKTGKPKTRNEIEGKTKDADGNYKRQLIFYQMLINEDGRYMMKSGELDFIEPDTSGKYHKERFEIKESEVESLKKLIREMADSILNMSFVESECDEKDCEYCKLGQILRRQ